MTRRFRCGFALTFALVLPACSGSNLATSPDAKAKTADGSALTDAAGPEAPACLGVTSMAGGPCTCTTDCPTGATCATEVETQFPGGLCAQGCVTTAPPPMGFICEALPAGGGGLFPTCDAMNRCRSGYVCIIDVMTHIGTCEPQCAHDSECVTNGHCDLYSGLCQAEPAGEGLVQACTRDEQCKSGECFTGSGATPNFCATKCDTTDPVCPEHGACVSISSDPGYTAGLCFLPCTQGPCAAGFACSAKGTCLPTF